MRILDRTGGKLKRFSKMVAVIFTLTLLVGCPILQGCASASSGSDSEQTQEDQCFGDDQPVTHPKS